MLVCSVAYYCSRARSRLADGEPRRVVQDSVSTLLTVYKRTIWRLESIYDILYASYTRKKGIQDVVGGVIHLSAFRRNGGCHAATSEGRCTQSQTPLRRTQSRFNRDSKDTSRRQHSTIHVRSNPFQPFSSPVIHALRFSVFITQSIIGVIITHSLTHSPHSPHSLTHSAHSLTHSGYIVSRKTR